MNTSARTRTKSSKASLLAPLHREAKKGSNGDHFTNPSGPLASSCPRSTRRGPPSIKTSRSILLVGPSLLSWIARTKNSSLLLPRDGMFQMMDWSTNLHWEMMSIFILIHVSAREKKEFLFQMWFTVFKDWLTQKWILQAHGYLPIR